MLTTIEEQNLVDIANSIREVKSETAKYKPSEMASAIGEILPLPDEALEISGKCDYKFAYGAWNWLIDNYGEKIVTNDINELSQMFYSNETIEHIPFVINCKENAQLDCKEMFYRCYALQEIPKIQNARVNYMDNLFYFCQKLRYLPEDLENYFDWTFIDKNSHTISSYARRNNTFAYCYSLRNVPMGFLKHNNRIISNSYSLFYYGFYNCYCLDNLVDIPISWHTGNWTSNAFTNAFAYCSRLNALTFETQEDGTPYTMNWKNQTIDLSNYVGYSQNATNILNYNSGITNDTKVESTNDYEALKDNNDWWTTFSYFGRYNHDSAVDTINSLPDCSAYGTNTIKFKGLAGRDTDGGAINTLTAEEIAVAIAKGWTVSLV